MKMIKTVFWALGLVLLLAGLSRAQSGLGALTGTIADASGAVIPGALVSITEVNTGVNWTVRSSTAGYYKVPVTPGTYRVTVEKSGFKKAVVADTVVGVAQVVTKNFTLEVGSTTQSVAVTSRAPLLTPDTAVLGGNITNEELNTLPIQVSSHGRDVQTFIFTSLPGTTGDFYSNEINGGQLFSAQILVDGLSVARPDLSGGNLFEISPSQDAISEFKVQTSNYSAEYGSTGGGVEAFVLKSGTNQFHGSAYEYVENPVFNAAGMVANAFGRPKAAVKQNDFGATLGGPIKRGRTFFFGSYEKSYYRNFVLGGLGTLPTQGMRQGDFSSWLGSTPIGSDALGRPVYQNEIYNPTTTRTVAAGAVDPVTGLTNNSGADATIRDPFSSNGQLNVISPGDFSKASSVLLPLYPNPQLSSNLRNQPFYSNSRPVYDTYRYDLKMDHVINDRQKIYGSFHYNRYQKVQGVIFPPYPGFPLNSTSSQFVGGDMERFHHDWTVNDHTLNDFALGHTRFFNINGGGTPDAQYTPQMGIPGVSDACFPRVRFSGIGSPPSFGACEHSAPRESFTVQDTLGYVRGKHSLKVGGEFTRYHYNTFEQGAVSGSFIFSNRETSLPGFSQTGHPFASFIMGAVDSGSRSVYTTEPGYRFGLFNAFFQDDWKVTSRLTLNLGVRWDLPLPKTEAYNRMSGVDFTVPNPGAGGIPGALVFLGQCSTSACNGRNSFQDRYYKEVAPRFGIAYQLRDNLVFRGGYGIAYGPPIENNTGSQNITGFNSGINLPRGASATGFAIDPVAYWSQLAGASLPAGAQVGVPAFTGTLPEYSLTAANGLGIDFLPANSLAQPYVQNWSAGLQWQLPSKTLLEVDYVGSKGTRLLQSEFSNMYNQIPNKYMPLGDMLSDDLAADLSDPGAAAVLAGYGITQLPYPGFDSTNFNPTVGQALRPFPQYDYITNNYPTMGSSTYHAMQVSATRRVSHGLDFIAAYTYSKTLTNANSALYNPSGSGYAQDFYNRNAEKSIASFDYTHYLKLTWIYALPFGHGMRWLNSAGHLDPLVSGWTVTGLQAYRSGSPLTLATELCTQTFSGAWGDGCGVRPNQLQGVPLTLSSSGLNLVDGTPYLNPAAFPDPSVTSLGYALAFGTAPRYLSSVRGPAYISEDFGILKETRLGERFTLDFRGDFFNVFNRTGRGNPDTDTDGGSFGLISSTSHAPRVIELSVRLKF